MALFGIKIYANFDSTGFFLPARHYKRNVESVQVSGLALQSCPAQLPYLETVERKEKYLASVRDSDRCYSFHELARLELEADKQLRRPPSLPFGSHLPIHTLVLKRSRDLSFRIDKVSRVAFCKMIVAVPIETRQHYAEFPARNAYSTHCSSHVINHNSKPSRRGLGNKFASWAVPRLQLIRVGILVNISTIVPLKVKQDCGLVEIWTGLDQGLTACYQ